MVKFALSRMLSAGGGERIMRERLSEPLHLQLASAWVALFGSYSQKVYYDLAFRQYTAFCLLDAAKRAAALRIDTISAVEFGVASGAGLLNICENARRATQATGVKFDIFGFDTGEGLPPPRSFRDHPELYQYGDFPMDLNALRGKLPSNASLVIGDIANTVPEFVRSKLTSPLGYIALDVDYHWSAVEALQILDGRPDQYLPIIDMYLDDCQSEYHNPSCGEMLACEEFNRASEFRKIYPYTALREKRLFKNASWISKIYAAHILDHRIRSEGVKRAAVKAIQNPYLKVANS